MADITMRVRANVSQAQKSFEDLANSSEGLREEFEKFAKRKNDATLDEFTQKQKRLQTAITATKGEKEALTRSVANYDRKIQQLIRDGLAPNSEQVRRLRGEQEALQKRLDASRKAQERKTRAVKAAKVALKASAVAIAGVVTGVVALTKRNANLANNLANSARVVGLCIEAYQELDYVMRMSGIENGEYMLNRLNRSIIDVRNETGTLTKFLEENYSQLLDQLKNVNDNEEAFMLLMDAINRAPNELKAAELAMAAFGRNGAHMVLAAQNGAEGINALREEARELGLVSNENAQAAMAFNDAMFRLRTSVQNMTQELTAKLLPALTNVVIRITNAIQRIGEFRARLQGVIGVVKSFVPPLAAAAAGTAAFVATLKIVNVAKQFVAAIQKIKGAVAALKSVKVLGTAISSVYKAVKTRGLSAFAAAGAAGVAFTTVLRRLNRELRDATVTNVEFNSSMDELDFSMFNVMAEEVADLNVELTRLAWGGAAEAVEALEEVTEKTMENLRQRLKDVDYTENQERNIRINAIQAFLAQRAKLESDDMEERKAEINRMGWYLLNSEELVAEERIAIHQAVYNAIQSMQEEAVEKAMKAAKNMLKAYSVFFGGFSKLLGEAGRENRRFFMASRAMALVQSGINTALAVTKTIAMFGFSPVGIIKAAGAAAKGAAQKAKIISSMIPSAETGGRFIVPPSRGVDNSIMRVNPGERIDVTPRGMTGGGESFNFQLVVDGRVFAELTNKQARAGELYTLQLAGNL